jgi:apolipoprotein N-acyltransferase
MRKINLDLRDLYGEHPRAITLAHFAIGAAMTLSFAPFNFYLLAPVFAAVILLDCLYLAPRSAARCAFWFAFGHFLGGTYWIYISVHVIGGAPLMVAFVLMLGLISIMALYFAGTAWLVSRLTAGDPLRLAIIGPALWVLIEWFRGWFLSGFPWLSLGYSQVDSSLSGWAPLLGIYGVSWVLLLSAAGLMLAVACRRQALALSLVVLPWLLGHGLQYYDWTEPVSDSVVTTIIQGGVAQEDKWLEEQRGPTVALYQEALGAVSESTLVVWPEVAIPALIGLGDDYLRVLQEDMRIRGKSLLMGLLEYDRAERLVYNSVLLLDGERQQVYRKRHLVPFGEYFPVPDFVREWMRLMDLPNSDIIAGSAEQPVLVAADGTKMGVAICYEDAYGAEQLYALPEATVMINVSNDGWFGNSIAAFQHLQIARMRALEVGRWVVRATNNGMSAFIGPRGELVAMAPRFEFATLTATVQPRSGLTPYARTGNAAIVLPLFLIALWYVRLQFQARGNDT